MTLYEIDSKIAEFFESNIDIETGEINDLEQLAELELAKETKIENTAIFVKCLYAEAKALEEEERKLAERKKSARAKADRISEWIKGYLQGEKFKTSRVVISYRNSKSVNITDITKLDKAFLKQAEPTADKVAIKEALKVGEVAGAEIVEKTSMVIK